MSIMRTICDLVYYHEGHEDNEEDNLVIASLIESHWLLGSGLLEFTYQQRVRYTLLHLTGITKKYSEGKRIRAKGNLFNVGFP